MLKATQLRPGMIIVHDGDLHLVHSVDHRTPGNKRGAMATRMRNLRNGSIMDYRFRAEDFVERAVLDEIEFQFLYADGQDYHFMNSETFEQIHVSGEVLGDAVYYLIPDLVLKLEFQFLYADGQDYHFMNSETFEQIHVSGEVLGDAVYYLIPDLVLKLEF